ncbi:TonB-dependent receptor [Gemmatimonas phototrophica]|uniref:TonB-dependent receptor n=1 Tax=Gemmatimonas phototrophica TaxID=1379270 RepID=UPI001313FACD|nr:TonB-dependent receptor [Gemmatimonas phototrophica]
MLFRCAQYALLTCLLLLVPTGVPVLAQAGTGAVQGVVLSRGDGAAVTSAEVRRVGSTMRVRTDDQGRFVITARVGDTLHVRVLGFRERRVPVVNTDAGSILRVMLEPLATVLPVFTTTMGQRVIRASDSPRSVTVLDRKEIDAVAAVSANQLLRQLPGLQELPAPPSKTSISIRGFDDSRVLVLVDGEPVAGSLIESRDIGRLSTIATERIEVTKGPSSVEFGSDALGGVINIVQAAPTKALTVDGLLRQGGLGREEATLGMSQTVGRVGYRLNGGWRQSDRVTGYNAAGSTFNRIFDLRSDVRVALSERWTARLDVQGSQERQRFPLDANFNGFIDNRGAQGFAEVQGPAMGGRLRARAFQQRFVYQYRQSRELLPIRGSADSLEQQERQGRYLLAYSKAAGQHVFDAGVQHSRRTLIAPTKVDGDSAKENITEVFARDSWTVGPVLLTAGARHTSSTLWGSSTNPSVGLAWQTTSALRLRGNVARGFRAPGFKEIRYTFFNPAGGYEIIGNAELRPESSVSGSVGGTWAPSTSASLDVELYRNDVKDLVDWSFRGNNAAGFQQYANVNVAEARTQGLETNARILVLGTELTAGYDFLRARNLLTGLPLTRRASHTARLRVSRSFNLLRGLLGDLSVRYTGGAPLIGIPSGAPITGPFSTEQGVVGQQGALLSMDAQWRLQLTSRAELSLGGNNLLGQRPALWTPAFDRQLFVGLHVRWSGSE